MALLFIQVLATAFTLFRMVSAALEVVVILTILPARLSFDFFGLSQFLEVVNGHVRIIWLRQDLHPFLVEPNI